MFLLLFELWNTRVLIVYHDVWIILLFEEATNVMLEENRLGHIECWLLWSMDNKSFPYQLLYVIRWCFCTNPSDRMLDTPFGLYQTGFGYSGRSPISFVYATPELKWSRKYFLSVSYLIFDRYLPLMKALRVNWLLRRHQFKINTGFWWCSQDDTPHTYRVRIKIFVWEWLFGFICAGFHL